MAVSAPMRQLGWRDSVAVESVLCVVRRSAKATLAATTATAVAVVPAGKPAGKQLKPAQIGPKLMRLSQNEWAAAMESKQESEVNFQQKGPHGAKRAARG